MNAIHLTCLKIVDFPDSPAPSNHQKVIRVTKRERKGNKHTRSIRYGRTRQENQENEVHGKIKKVFLFVWSAFLHTYAV